MKLMIITDDGKAVDITAASALIDHIGTFKEEYKLDGEWWKKAHDLANIVAVEVTASLMRMTYRLKKKAEEEVQ